MTLIFLLILFYTPYCLTEVWNVYVYTGNERYAGTDSNVYIRLLNAQGESTSEYQLTHRNWMPDNNQFPVRNLFEIGAKERFRIRTEDIGSVAEIQIRHNNSPSFQADWLLDQIIIERNGDSIKYVFKCNCWLRRSRPYIKLSALPDPRSSDKNKTNNSSSTTNRTFVIILIVLIILMIAMFCCYNGYRRRRQRQHTIEQIQQEPSLLDTYHSQPSEPQLWMDTLSRWKNLRHGLSTYNHTTQTTAVAVSTDQPPAYEDLYPTSTVPISTNS